MSDPRKASLLVVFLTVFIDLLGFGMVLPLLPLYGEQFAAQHGLSHQTQGWILGVLMASFSAVQFVFLPVWGRLSDRFGRRPIILIGLAGSATFYALFGLATAWRSLLGLLVARIGAGVCGATISTAQAYIADVTPHEGRAKGMALIGAAFALGFTLGPLLSSAALLAGTEAAANPWPGFVAAGLSAAALLLAVTCLGESRRPDSQQAARPLLDAVALRAALRVPSVGLLILTSFIAVFSFANLESTLSVLVERVAQAFQAGRLESGLLEWLDAAIRRWGYQRQDQVTLIVVLIVFAYLGIVLTIAQGVLVRRLAGKLSEAAMAVLGGLLAIAGFVLLARATAANDLGLVLVGLAVEVTGFALVNPSLQSLISRRTSPEHQGGVLGLAQSATSLARILGPVCGLRLFAQSPTWPYWFASGLLGIGLVMVVVAARRGTDFPAGA